MAAVHPPPVTHYENFPVASWLCPPALRAPIAAIYHFARTADDLADEGEASADARLVDLAAYRAELSACASQGGSTSTSPRWPQVFVPLASAIATHRLPVGLLLDLLSAFEQDVRKTGAGEAYRDRDELLHYCRRSANPVGRLLLHLWGIHDARSLAQSDAICTALQLINFWQDFSRDHPVGRCYLPHADAQAHGLNPQDLCALHDSPATQALVRELVGWARQLMTQGQGLAPRLPGRVGWELRLVVQGGLRILDKIEALQYRSLRQRPRLHLWDVPLMLWRAARMRA